MNILYLEHYPHYMMGTSNQAAEISEENLMLLSLLVSDREDLSDVFWELDDEELADDGVLEMKDGNTLYAFHDMIMGGAYGDEIPAQTIKHWKRVWRALKTKGYYVDQWEEGTHGFALPEMKNVAIDEIARQEAKVNEDCFAW